MDPLVIELALLDSGMGLGDAHALIWERPAEYLRLFLKLREEKRMIEVTTRQQRDAF